MCFEVEGLTKLENTSRAVFLGTHATKSPWHNMHVSLYTAQKTKGILTSERLKIIHVVSNKLRQSTTYIIAQQLVIETQFHARVSIYQRSPQPRVSTE
jgi:hypothetical protein